MKTVFVSLLICVFFLFAGHVYAEDVTATTVTDAEKETIVIQCTEIWHQYKASLSEGDIEGALKHVSESEKEYFRYALQSQQRAVHLGEIDLEYVRNNSVARFKMLVKAELMPGDDIPPGYSVGDTIESEGYVVFVRDPAGKWKIDFY